MSVRWTSVSNAANLERHWRELRRPKDESEEHQSRALTWNLICRARNAEDAERTATQMWEIGPRHPARVFLVVPAETGTEVRVAEQPRGSELAWFAISPERAASLVAPLLVSDLPTFLLWHGPAPTAGATYDEFLHWTHMARRVLVDAHLLRLRVTDLGALAAALPPTCSLNDLAWTRLTPWRQLLCQGLEADVSSVLRIRRLTLCGDQSNVSAALFAGWMADKLQWGSVARVGADELRLAGPQGQAINVRFVPAGAHEALLRRLVVEEEGDGLVVEIEHRGAHVTMNVQRAGKVLAHWAGATASAELLRGETASLCEELTIGCADWVFRRALECGLEMQRCLERGAA